LDVARIEAGKIALELSECDLDSIVSRSVSSVSPLASGKNIEILIPTLATTFTGDEERLIQVLVNLLSNAVKYSEPGSTIAIEAELLSDSLKLSVADTGCGIPEESRNRIFDRFEQVSTADRKEKGGAGLGLAICKMIVEAHKGKIGVESEVGKGSTFWFSLPKMSK
jgi:signal transduction histidine kinase